MDITDACEWGGGSPYKSLPVLSEGSVMIQCEFCDELKGLPGGRFASIYAGLADSRVVMDTDNFVVMPTLGQLFQGSMLILPKQHVETSAKLAAELRVELSEILDRVMGRVRQCGSPVFFEHGALSCTGGSCGIYHAHIHVVPLPEQVSAKTFLPGVGHNAVRLDDALEALAESSHYLLFGDGTDIRYGDVASLGFVPPSQYFRRVLADHFAVARSWNWRDFSVPEQDLLKSLILFGGANAVERRTY